MAVAVVLCGVVILGFVSAGNTSDYVIAVIGEVSRPNMTIPLRTGDVYLCFHPTPMEDLTHVYRTVHYLERTKAADLLIFLEPSLDFIWNRDRILNQVTTQHLIWGDVSTVKEHNAGNMRLCNESNSYHDNKELGAMEENYASKSSARNDLHVMEEERIGRSSPVLNTLFSVPDIMASFLKMLNWREIVFVYEDVTERELDKITERLNISTGVKFATYHVDLVNKMFLDLNATINRITRLVEGKVTFVVLCRLECAKLVLEQGNMFDESYNLNRTVLRIASRWLVLLYVRDIQSMDYEMLARNAEDTDNVLVVPIPELDFPNKQTFFDTVPQMLRGLEVSVSDWKDAIRKGIFELSSRVSNLEGCQVAVMKTLLWVLKPSVREFSDVGYVSADGNVSLFAPGFPNTEFGYNTKEFHVSIIEYPPFVVKENGTFTGFCIDILHLLSETLNFTYRVTPVPDGNYGLVTNYDTMRFNGLIGQVQRKEVDMIVGDVAITKERESVMDFTYPFHYGFSTVVLRRPDNSGQLYMKLLKPLKLELIGAIWGALIVVWITLHVLEIKNTYYDPRSTAWSYSHQQHTDSEPSGANTNIDCIQRFCARSSARSISRNQPSMHSFAVKNTGNRRPTMFGSHYNYHNCKLGHCGIHNFIDALSVLYCIMLNEGISNRHLPKSITGRTLLASWSLFSLVTVATYSGNLIAFLTVTKDKKPFDTLKEMTKTSYKWGTIGGSFWEQNFMTSETATFKAIGDGMRKFNKTDPGVLSGSNAYHLNKVLTDDKYAFIGDDGSIDLAMASNCDLIKTKERFMPLIEAFGFPEGSPHARIFEKPTLTLHESGVIMTLRRKWWPSSRKCNDGDKTEAKPVTILDVQGAFIVAAGGLSLALLAFCFEMASRRMCQVFEMTIRQRSEEVNNG